MEPLNLVLTETKKGIFIEPIIGLVGFSEYEQFEYRDAATREKQRNAPSQEGDLDLTLYGLRKFLRLALKGNPSVLELLYALGPQCLIRTPLGKELQELAPQIISRQAGKAFIGYMWSQRQRLLGEAGQKKVNRFDLEEKFGYDVKYAMHIVRLGFQGRSLLQSGIISHPLEKEELAFCRSIRAGSVPLQDVLTKAGDLEREVRDLADSGPLQEYPNEAVVQDWMIETYKKQWYLDDAVEHMLKYQPSYLM